MPDTLASVCNNIAFANPPASSSGFCQGFVYDDAKNIAFFKPQPASGLLDTSNLCSSPTCYTWLRKQGCLHLLTYLLILLAQSCLSCSRTCEEHMHGIATMTPISDCIEEHNAWLCEEAQQDVAAIAALLMLHTVCLQQQEELLCRVSHSLPQPRLVTSQVRQDCSYHCMLPPVQHASQVHHFQCT